ncbi:MAG: hypothetical protein HQK49_03215 [Oligoflexia bacterium]|nr:hypothetical protein [Oligoflexia bacterium]
MLQEIKTYLGKLTLTLKVLMVFIYFLLLLAIGYPLLVKGVGTSIFDDKISKLDLGPKIINETLFLAYIIIGVCILAIVFYNFFIVSKFNKVIDKVSKDVDELTKKNKNSKPFSYKVDFVARDKLKRIDEYNSVGVRFSGMIKERLEHLRGFKNNLQEELKDSETVCKELTNLFDDFEKSLSERSRSEMGQYLDKVGRYFHEINENIFKTQLLVFNASIESFKGDSNSKQLPSLTTEIDSLTNKNSVLLESINKEIEDHDSKIISQNEENINKLLEIGRLIAKIMYHIHKTIDTIQLMGKSMEDEDFNVMDTKFSEHLALYKRDHQRMDSLLKEVWKQFDKSIEDINGISSKFTYSKSTIRMEDDLFAQTLQNAKDTIAPASAQASAQASTGVATGAAIATTVDPTSNQDISSTSSTSSNIQQTKAKTQIAANSNNGIEDIVLQNLESLYGIHPKQLAEMLLKDVSMTMNQHQV